MHTYKKKFKHYFYLLFTEQGSLLLYPPSIPGRGPHHDCYSPSARNAQKCGSPVGLCEFLPDLDYVGRIANKTLYYSCARGLLGLQNAGSGLWLNDLQNHWLASHCSPSTHPCGWYSITPHSPKSGRRVFGHLVSY